MSEGVVLGMDEADYHQHPAFSASKAKTILDSPARFKHEYLDGNRVYKKAFDLGSAVHHKVLGTGYPLDVYDFDSWRKAEARAKRDESRAAGRIPMLKHEMGPVDAMAEAVLANGLARKLFEREGNAEASVFAEHLGIPLRCRFDYLPDEGGIVVDLKTTSGSASPGGFAKTAADLRYHVARGHYLDVLKRATRRDAEMVFIVVETAPPHLVGVRQLNQEFAEMGEAESMEARDIYRACLESGEWPGYPEIIRLVQPPMWAVYDHQDRFGEKEQ